MKRRLKDGLEAWVDLWRHTEHPRSMAAVRIGVATVMLVDLVWMRHLGLVVTLMGAADAGGLGTVGRNGAAEWVVGLLGTGAGLPEGLWWGMTGSAALLWLGILPRGAALVLCLLSAQLALILPAADRGIDMLLRNVLLLLAFARSGDTWSLPTLLRYGRVAAPASTRVQAWPRYLLAFQLVVVYFTAGVSKVASSWTPLVGMSALFVAMSDPHFQRIPDDWLRAGYRLTQLGTLCSWLWEWSAPVLLLAWWCRYTSDRGGRLRAWMNRWPVAELYLLVGAFFHVGTHLVLRLGIFPFAMLALYPAAAHPDRLLGWWQSLSGRWRS